jgi:hypothetical protein
VTDRGKSGIHRHIVARLSILASRDKRLAFCGKRLFEGIGTLVHMKTFERSQIKGQGTQDFAVVGVHKGSVVLEANEWDLSMDVYRVVTLYLTPASALNLAEQLVSCAAGANPEGAMSH